MITEAPDMGIDVLSDLEFEVPKQCEGGHFDPEWAELHEDGPLSWVLMHPCKTEIRELAIKCQRYIESNWWEAEWLCVHCNQTLTPDEFLTVVGPVEE